MNVYDVEKVERMLPLLRSYARSLTNYAKWVADVFTRKMEQKELDDCLLDCWQRREALEIEFRALGCSICHCRRGLVDVPMIHPHANEIVLACVDVKTMGVDDLKVHDQGNFRERKGIWEYEAKNCE